MKFFGLSVLTLALVLVPNALWAAKCDAQNSDAPCRNAKLQAVCAKGDRIGMCAPEDWVGEEAECRCVLDRPIARRPIDALRRVRRGIHDIVREVILDEPRYVVIEPRSPRYACRNSNIFGKYADGGGCNTFGCWPPGGSCNPFGCSATDECHPSACRDKIDSYQCDNYVFGE